MFQKLYKHLDDISLSLREKDPGTDAANQVREKMLEQLQQLNESIRAGEAQVLSEQRKFAKYVAVGNGIIIFFIAVLIFVEIRTRPTAEPVAVTHQIPAPPLAETSADDIRRRENEQRLDSLVTVQSQSIKELKDLNKSAVYSLRRIRKHFEDLDKKALAESPGADTVSPRNN